MKYIKLSAIIILAGCMLSCLSNKLDTDFTSAAIVGKITDMDNQPCVNVTIVLDKKTKTVSDINGSFYFNDVTRGQHTFKFTKEGYREEVRIYEFMNISQVIYQKMISLEQILAEIEKALDDKKITLAQEYMEIAAAIDAKNPILNYLYGMLYYKTGRYALAIEKLESILKDGYEEPFVYLTLTDIYELKLTDYAKAHEYILKYLELADDNAAKLREKIIAGFLTTEESGATPAPETTDEATPEPQ